MTRWAAPDPTDTTLSRRSRRELAWTLRHRRGWEMARIGTRLGVKAAAVSRLLRREAAVRGEDPALTDERPEPPAPLLSPALAVVIGLFFSIGRRVPRSNHATQSSLHHVLIASRRGSKGAEHLILIGSTVV